MIAEDARIVPLRRHDPRTDQPPDDPLRALAAAFAIDTEYHDWQGRPQVVGAATLRAVLAAFGVDASNPRRCRDALAQRRHAISTQVLPPCVVVRSGQDAGVATGGPITAARIEFEDGSTRVLPAAESATPGVAIPGVAIPADAPLGYHRLVVTRDGREHAAALIVTPDVLSVPDGLRQPVWGLAAQLYSVRSSRSWGTGDLDDLAGLARWSATEHGADFVLVNPVHAAEVVAPMTSSPYLPSTRRFANPLYLQVERITEWDGLTPQARADFGARGAALLAATSELLDRDAAWALKRAALEEIFAVTRSADRDAEFRGYCAREGPDLDRFATWCVLTEQHGASWQSWPAQLRDPNGPGTASFAAEHAVRVDFHRWLQWQLDEQLRRAQVIARAAGMSIGVVHDLAVGVNPDGADAWMWQDVLATGVSVGAPPDDYSQLGQNWEQPPWRPDRLAELGYGPLRGVFRAALRHGGGLRVDHIIGLFRLWWIPVGMRAGQGTYVHYDHDALIGVLALEAERAGALIIGEDLGNVEPATREYLARRGLFGTSILWFESDGTGPLAPQRWREHCLASVTTHDLPPTTGYLAGDHIRLRERLRLLTRSLDDELAAEAHDKAAWLEQLRRYRLLPADEARDADDIPETDDIVVALHVFLTRTPALLRCVALTDAVGERRTQNQPGTSEAQYPNWRIPLGGPQGEPVLLDDLFTDPHVMRLIAAIRS